jgi:hypothetical protein
MGASSVSYSDSFTFSFLPETLMTFGVFSQLFGPEHFDFFLFGTKNVNIKINKAMS